MFVVVVFDLFFFWGGAWGSMILQWPLCLSIVDRPFVTSFEELKPRAIGFDIGMCQNRDLDPTWLRLSFVASLCTNLKKGTEPQQQPGLTLMPLTSTS